MKPITKILLAFATVVLLNTTCYGRMGTSWGSPTTIAGDTDVATDGSLVYAYHFGPLGTADAIVNGVTFTGGPINSFNSNTLSFGGNSIVETEPGWTIYSLDSRGVNVAPYYNLSSNYKSLLDTALTSGMPNMLELTLNGLTAGNKYEIQWWAEYDIAMSNLYQSIRVTDANSVTLNANTTNANGGLGQYVIGTFTATGASEVFDFQNDSVGAAQQYDGPIINAFQLRDVTAVPEPSTWLLALGGLTMLGAFRLRRK